MDLQSRYRGGLEQKSVQSFASASAAYAACTRTTLCAFDLIQVITIYFYVLTAYQAAL